MLRNVTGSHDLAFGRRIIVKYFLVKEQIFFLPTMSATRALLPSGAGGTGSWGPGCFGYKKPSLSTALSTPAGVNDSIGCPLALPGCANVFVILSTA